MGKITIRSLRIEGDTAFVPLSQGLEAVVDAGDVALVGGRNWYAVRDRNKVYAYTNIRVDGRRTTLKMHRLILGGDNDQQIDHWDGDGLNNRRANLRTATNAQNAWNAGRPVHNTSGFKGVGWVKRNRKWQARIAVNSRVFHIGFFDDPTDAHEAFRRAAEVHHGEFARFE